MSHLWTGWRHQVYGPNYNLLTGLEATFVRDCFSTEDSAKQCSITAISVFFAATTSHTNRAMLTQYGI